MSNNTIKYFKATFFTQQSKMIYHRTENIKNEKIMEILLWLGL